MKCPRTREERHAAHVLEFDNGESYIHLLSSTSINITMAFGHLWLITSDTGIPHQTLHLNRQKSAMLPFLGTREWEVTANGAAVIEHLMECATNEGTSAVSHLAIAECCSIPVVCGPTRSV